MITGSHLLAIISLWIATQIAASLAKSISEALVHEKRKRA